MSIHSYITSELHHLYFKYLFIVVYYGNLQKALGKEMSQFLQLAEGNNRVLE